VRAAVVAVVASAGCITALTVTTPPPIADGSTAPAFALHAQDGHVVALADANAHGPVVLVFYRGFW
jgi:hypothetical protein